MKNKFYWKYVHTPLTNTIALITIFGVGYFLLLIT